MKYHSQVADYTDHRSASPSEENTKFYNPEFKKHIKRK